MGYIHPETVHPRWVLCALAGSFPTSYWRVEQAHPLTLRRGPRLQLSIYGAPLVVAVAEWPRIRRGLSLRPPVELDIDMMRAGDELHSRRGSGQSSGLPE